MIKKKHLNRELTLISTPHFPYSVKKKSKKQHRVLLGIGGNIGDVLRRFEHLFHYLRASRFVDILETAPMLKNPPFGYREQNDFYNSTVALQTDLSPRELLRYVLQVEKHFGRKRLFKDGPRTLDIDILFYENVKMDTPELTLPHPGWTQRSSVLIPLSKMKGKI